MKTLTIFFLLLGASWLQAHDLHHTVVQKQAIVVRFSFGGDTDFSYQKYEIYAPDSDIPFAVGRTDSLSRIVFLPDKAGKWKIKAMSEDGHGKEVGITVGENFAVEEYSKTNFEKFQKLFVGIAVIFMVFLLLQFYLKRRKK